MGYSPQNLSTISLNSVVVDGPTEVKAEFAKLRYGPGPVSFNATGNLVTVENKVANAAPPNSCAGKFITLPVPNFDSVPARAHR
jgi:lipopolysaccharide export system protein LptA